jgi:hypothetical protein
MAKSESRKKKVEAIPSSFASIEEAAEFWNSHSVADYWDETREIEGVKINLIRRHVHIDADLARKIHNVARRRGVSAETLVNLWLQEKTS